MSLLVYSKVVVYTLLEVQAHYLLAIIVLRPYKLYVNCYFVSNLYSNQLYVNLIFIFWGIVQPLEHQESKKKK